MDLRAAVAATVSYDSARDRWFLVLEGPTAEVIEEVEVPWDGDGGFASAGLDRVAPLLNSRGLAYVGPWTEYGGGWTVSVNPIADWWGRKRGHGQRA